MTVWLQGTYFCNPPGGHVELLWGGYMGNFSDNCSRAAVLNMADHWNSCCDVFRARFYGEHEIESTFVWRQGRMCGVEISPLLHFIYIYIYISDRKPHGPTFITASVMGNVHLCGRITLTWIQQVFGRRISLWRTMEACQTDILKLFFLILNIGTILKSFKHCSSMSVSWRISIIVRSRSGSSEKVRSQSRFKVTRQLKSAAYSFVQWDRVTAADLCSLIQILSEMSWLHTWMFGVKPLRVLSPPHEIFASDDHKVVVQDSPVKSLRERKMMFSPCAIPQLMKIHKLDLSTVFGSKLLEGKNESNSIFFTIISSNGFTPAIRMTHSQ